MNLICIKSRSLFVNVCFGSKADIEARPADVRFTPEFVAKRGRLRRLGWS
jgi:hypothetical protein